MIPPLPAAGLRARISAIAVAMSLALVIGVVWVAWSGARDSSQRLAEHELQHQTLRIAQQLAARLDETWVRIDGLARQPLIAGSLLDSEGRETYLRPVLDDARALAEGQARLRLVDYRGRTLMSAPAGQAWAETGDRVWLDAVLRDGRPKAALLPVGDTFDLLLAAPVIYRATASVEGALLLEIDLAAWLEGLHDALGRDGSLSQIELRSGERTLARLDFGSAAGAVIQGSQALKLKPPLDGLQLSLRASLPRADHEQPLQQLANRFWMIGLFAVIAALLVSQWLTHLLSYRIEELAEVARAFGERRPAPPGLAALSARHDELGELARTLDEQFHHLHRVGRHLEERVGEAMRDLYRAQQVSRIGSWVFDPAEHGFVCTPEAARVCGLGADMRIRPRALWRRIDAEDRQAVRAAWKSCLSIGSCAVEFRLDAGEAQRWLRVHAEREDLLGLVGGRIIGTLQDVTAERRSELEKRRALAVFEHCSQGILVTDAQARILAVNPAFTRITGYAADEVLGRTPALLKSGRQPAGFYAAMWQSLLADGRWEGEIWNRRKGGEHYPQWLTITAVPDPRGGGDYVALLSDISERKRQEEETWRRANFDALTGLANLQLFRDRLGDALAAFRRERRSLAVVCLDLHGIRAINDTLGHDAGDSLLIEVARRLQMTVGIQDTVARRSGDEFLLLIESLDAWPDLETLAEILVERVGRPFVLGGGEHRVSASLGAALFPRDGQTPGELLRHADLAMLHARQGEGKAWRVYSHELEADALERRQLLLDLHEAIAFHAFTLQFQPIVDASDGRIVSVEALLRWRHADGTLVSPREFIPAAEESGLIVELGDWVLGEALRQRRAWAEPQRALPGLSLNVRGLQFDHDRLRLALEDLGRGDAAALGGLCLEFPEGVLSEGEARAPEVFALIREMGVRLVIDDFGQAQASLSQLQRFTIDEVKIDAALVASCAEPGGSRSMVEAIVSMAHALGIGVTAKGVETRAQADLLRRIGCDRLQGHYISPPMFADALRARLGEVLLQPLGEDEDFSV